MARKKVSARKIAVEEKTKVPAVNKPKPVGKAIRKVSPIPLLSFDRWFETTGRPPHHKRGMRAYTAMRGKHPKKFWDQLFAGY